MAQGLIRSEETRNHMTGLLWVNMGNLEGDMQDLQEDMEDALEQIETGVPEIEAVRDQFHAELIAAGMKKLNGPNLIADKQNFWGTRNIPSSAVIEETLTVPAEDATAAAAALTYTITNENITSSYVLHDKTTSDSTVVAWGDITGTFSAGSATITIAPRSGAHNAAVTVKVYLCTVTSATVPYGRSWKTYGSSQAWITNIANSGITYPGDDDDEVKEAYAALTGNNIVTEEDGATYNTALAWTVTNPPSSGWGNCDWLIFTYGWGTGGLNGLPPMEDGKTYTLSIWARITSGTNACLQLAYGFDRNGNSPVSPTGSGHELRSGYIEINGSGWQRVSWTFVYHAQSVGTGYTRTNDPRVGIGVCRKYAGTVQTCGYRMVEGELWLPDASKPLTDKADKVASATAGHVAALDANGNLTDSGHALSEYADKTNPAFTGTLTLGSTTMTENQLSALLSLQSANGQSF